MHYMVGRLLKQNTSTVPQLYAIYPLFSAGDPDNELIETPESKQNRFN